MDVAVAVVGGGQAGLAASRELTAAGVEHVVLERGRVAETWRRRWESFRLVTPNWSVQLPGRAYDGDDGFMPRDEVVAWLERYAEGLPVQEGVEVRSLAARDGGFVLETSQGRLTAREVVLATGAYQRPHRPAAAASLPGSLHQLDVEGYRDEASLPPGGVLVVGSGQSGCQIAEEVHLAGRDVVLACGRAPWAPRRIGGTDVFRWLLDTGFLDAPAESLPSPAARLAANILVTGHHGGADLNLRTLRALGVTLAGRFLGAEGREARFAPDLAASVAWGDERFGQLAALVRAHCARNGLDEPELAEPGPFAPEAPERIDLSGFGAVLFASGFRPDYASWLPWPEAFDEHGFPLQRDGASTVVPGLYFLGVHFLRTRKSSLLVGVGEDAAVVARQVAASLREPALR